MNNSYQTLENTITKQGNTISLLGFSDNIGQTLIIGVVHGDEPQGEYLINKYLNENKKEGVSYNEA